MSTYQKHYGVFALQLPVYFGLSLDHLMIVSQSRGPKDVLMNEQNFRRVF